MQSIIEEIRGLEGEVLGISVDPPEKSRKVVTGKKLDFLLLSDQEGKAIDAFGVRHVGGGFEGDIARPAMFILDRQGNVVWRHLTENWRVRVRPETVLEQLRQIR